MAPPNQSNKRGRKAGATYNRRTKAQIDQDKKKEAEKKKEAAENKLKRSREANEAFFAPRGKGPKLGAAAQPGAPPDVQADPPALPLLPPPPPPPLPPPPANNDEDDLAADVPYSLAVVPEIFRKAVGTAADEIRVWSKQQSSSWNQYGHHRFSSNGCPWKGVEKAWPDPNMATRRVSIVDFLFLTG